VFKSLCDLLSISLLLILWKKCLPKSKVKGDVLSLSDKVEILDLLKGTISLVEAEWQYGKNHGSAEQQ
jgi:hypothetical protein